MVSQDYNEREPKLSFFGGNNMKTKYGDRENEGGHNSMNKQTKKLASTSFLLFNNYIIITIKISLKRIKSCLKMFVLRRSPKNIFSVSHTLQSCEVCKTSLSSPKIFLRLVDDFSFVVGVADDGTGNVILVIFV